MSDAGWLCTTKETQSHGRLGEGYGDVLGESYVWKADLPNARRIAIGDAIVLWDNEVLLGVSWIDEIEEFTALRSTYTCPSCSKADVRTRITVLPRYRCGDCGATFNEAVMINTEAQYFRANYAAGWTPAVKSIGRADCKSMSVHPASQLSLQDIDMGRFRVLVDNLGTHAAATRRRDLARQNGHRLSTVRTRVGQGAFRDRILRHYGAVCAVTGPAPQPVLEAAHLYRYSEVGEHHSDGGLMLRRDVHKLFDLGLITVEPTHTTIDIHADLTIHPTYGDLHGKSLRVSVSHKTKDWLDLHWEQFRGRDLTGTSS